MTRLLTGLLAALLALSFAMPADAGRKCKDGKVYDPDTGRCVTDRGS